jgi:hypothetical protein
MSKCKFSLTSVDARRHQVVANQELMEKPKTISLGKVADAVH